MDRRRAVKNTIWTLLRIGIAAALIVWIFTSGGVDVGEFAQRVRGLHPVWAILGFLAFGACLGLGIVRWSLLLRVQGMVVRPRRLAGIYFIGHFFNAFMFGAVGGDLIKALYITRETHRRKIEAVMTILVDRLIGLYALLLISGIAMALAYPFYLANPATWKPALFILALLAAATIGTALLLQRRWFERIPLVRWIGDRIPGRSILVRLYDAFEVYRHHPRTVAVALALSLGVHSALVVETWLLSRGLGFDLALGDAFAVVPLVLCIAAIPITPGGWGVREFMAREIFPATGMTPETAIAISVLYGAITLVWSLLGAIPFFLHRSGIPRDEDVAERDEDVAERDEDVDENEV